MRIKITNNKGQKLTLSELKKEVRKQTLINLISQGELISDKIFTRIRLQRLIAQGKLHPTVFSGKTYFNKNEVLTCLKAEGINFKNNYEQGTVSKTGKNQGQAQLFE